MQIQTSIGLPSQRASGNPNVPGGTFGELLKSTLSPDYYTLAKNNRVFVSAGAGLNPTAFVGGAAGTPLIGLYNPAGSGFDLVLIRLRLNVRTTGTVAATAQAFSFWGVNQGGVAVTGTATAPRNVYSMAQTGSVATAMVNTANTAALASNLIAPSISLGNVGATAAVNAVSFVDEIKGEIVVSPGCYLAFGAAQTLTGGSLDVGLIWAEVPA